MRNMKKTTVLAILCLLVVSAFAFAGCTRDDDTPTVPETNQQAEQPTVPVTPPPPEEALVEQVEDEGILAIINEPATLNMSWWGADARHDAIIDALNHFMDLHPHIRVNYSPSGWDNYHDALTIQIMAGQAPDLFAYSTMEIVNYAPFLIDYNEYMDLFPFLEERRGMLNTSTYMVGGRVVSVPAGLGAHVNLFNITLFDQAGVPHPTNDMTTLELWDLQEQVVAALAEQGVDAYVDSGWYWGPGWDSHSTGQSNPNWIDFTNFETQPPVFQPNMDELRYTWSRVERHWDLGVLPRAGDEEVSFAMHNALFGNSVNPRNDMEQTTHELGIFLGPRRFDTNSPVTVQSPGPGLNWGISANSDNKYHALFLLEFLQTNPTAVQTIGFNVGTPTNPGALAALRETLEPGGPEYQQLQIVEMSREGVDVWIDRPNVAGMAEATRAWRGVFEEWVFGMIDIEEYLERVIPEMQEAVNEFFIAQGE